MCSGAYKRSLAILISIGDITIHQTWVFAIHNDLVSASVVARPYPFPSFQPVSEFNSFKVDNRSGEQWISLKRKFGHNEDIKIEATMFDGSVPAKKSGGGGGGIGEDVQLHITMVVNISKEEGGNALEIICSVWPDTIEINKLFIRKSGNMPAQPYTGPEFKELDDELQDSLYEFLEARGINDDLATFLHTYMKNKDKTEFIRWMGTVKSYIEKKKSD